MTIHENVENTRVGVTRGQIMYVLPNSRHFHRRLHHPASIPTFRRPFRPVSHSIRSSSGPNATREYCLFAGWIVAQAPFRSIVPCQAMPCHAILSTPTCTLHGCSERRPTPCLLPWTCVCAVCLGLQTLIVVYIISTLEDPPGRPLRRRKFQTQHFHFFPSYTSRECGTHYTQSALSVPVFHLTTPKWWGPLSPFKPFKPPSLLPFFPPISCTSFVSQTRACYGKCRPKDDGAGLAGNVHWASVVCRQHHQKYNFTLHFHVPKPFTRETRRAILTALNKVAPAQHVLGRFCPHSLTKRTPKAAYAIYSVLNRLGLQVDSLTVSWTRESSFLFEIRKSSHNKYYYQLKQM